MNGLYEWIHDDITWCGNDCYYTECERNSANRLSHEGLLSIALFRDTEMCPLNRSTDENEHERVKENEQTATHCQDDGKDQD